MRVHLDSGHDARRILVECREDRKSIWAKFIFSIPRPLTDANRDVSHATPNLHLTDIYLYREGWQTHPAHFLPLRKTFIACVALKDTVFKLAHLRSFCFCFGERHLARKFLEDEDVLLKLNELSDPEARKCLVELGPDKAAVTVKGRVCMRYRDAVRYFADERAREGATKLEIVSLPGRL